MQVITKNRKSIFLKRADKEILNRRSLHSLHITIKSYSSQSDNLRSCQSVIWPKDRLYATLQSDHLI